MKGELHLKIVRSQEHNAPSGEGHPDKGPWLAVWLKNGQRALKKEYVVFDALVNEFRRVVRDKSITVHLYNAMGQLLWTISPDNLEKENLYWYTITIPGIKNSPVEIERPLCPNCGIEAVLEPAHWENAKSKLGQWRWVCIQCDFAVSTPVDQRWDATGELGSRGTRRLRAELRDKISLLSEKRQCSEKDVYTLLNEHFGTEKENRLNVSSMSVNQLQEAFAFIQEYLVSE